MLKRTIGFIIFLCILLMTIFAQTNAQWVVQTPVSNVKVTAYWEANGAKDIDIIDSQRLAIDLIQRSSVESSARITVNGQVYGVETLAPGETKTIFSSIINYGSAAQNNVEVVVVATEMLSGTETSRDTVTCNYLPLGTGTILSFHVKDNYNRPVVGLPIDVLFPASTSELNDTMYTDKNGEILNWNLQTSRGFGYAGEVIIQNVETEQYQANSLNYYINFGQNDINIDVTSKIAPTSSPSLVADWSFLLSVIALIGFLMLLSIVAFAYVKRKK